MRAALLGTVCVLALTQGALADAMLTESVVVSGRATDLTGIAVSSNEGSISAGDMALRPLLRPAEVVENIPGVIVTQHSGTGKANQYFLRGFNLDHGTDLAISLDGMPVNMVSHAHGQGYSDLNFVIPELIEQVNYKKGPYYADVGDFGAAGAFNIRYYDSLPEGIARLDIGQQCRRGHRIAGAGQDRDAQRAVRRGRRTRGRTQWLERQRVPVETDDLGLDAGHRLGHGARR